MFELHTHINGISDVQVPLPQFGHLVMCVFVGVGTGVVVGGTAEVVMASEMDILVVKEPTDFVSDCETENVIVTERLRVPDVVMDKEFVWVDVGIFEWVIESVGEGVGGGVSVGGSVLDRVSGAEMESVVVPVWAGVSVCDHVADFVGAFVTVKPGLLGVWIEDCVSVSAPVLECVRGADIVSGSDLVIFPLCDD